MASKDNPEAIAYLLECTMEEARVMVAAKDLLEAARKLLALMDEVPIDPRLGDETDRVFPRYEFEDLRAAIAKAEQEHD